MARMDIDPKLIRLSKQLYNNPTFMVEIDGQQSTWEKQTTGIRQGCTLSPYLFIILMTTIFHDVKLNQELQQTLHDNRPP